MVARLYGSILTYIKMTLEFSTVSIAYATTHEKRVRKPEPVAGRAAVSGLREP